MPCILAATTVKGLRTLKQVLWTMVIIGMAGSLRREHKQHVWGVSISNVYEVLGAECASVRTRMQT